MLIKRFFALIGIAFGLAACVGAGNDGWNSEYGDTAAGQPAAMRNDFHYPEYGIYGPDAGMYTYTPVSEAKNISVLLPMSGPHSKIGTGLAASIEIAFLSRKYENVNVVFYDMSGDRTNRQNVITNALVGEPDIILGPVFAEDAAMLRAAKPETLPALSFTSDATALGNGVMTMALIPSQSVEEIVREIARDNANGFVVFAPKNQSGELMAGAAVNAANIYDAPLDGVFYYAEGNSESIKNAAQSASMFDARSAANNRAREILSDILVKESLTASQKSSLNAQLDKISKSDTLGKIPYDGILFLGNANDSKTLVSFLRYFDVGARDVNLYGTALWDGSDVITDFTMTGAKFAALPKESPDFVKLYTELGGAAPSRLDSFGFDAAVLSIGMLHSNKTPAEYLLATGGYMGLDGLFRLRPNGTAERALQIVELNGTPDARIARAAATDFLTPVYNISPNNISKAGEMALVANGINPSDYIKIPDALRNKYKSKTYGANTAPAIQTDSPADEVVILPEDDSEIISMPDFQPAVLESVDRQLIDSVEISD